MYNYTILMEVFIFLVVNGCELIIKKIYSGILTNVVKYEFNIKLYKLS